MAIVPNIVGLVRGIKDRQRNARIDDQLRNYLNIHPEQVGDFAGVAEEDPRVAMALNQQIAQQRAEQEDRQRKRVSDDIGLVSRAFRGLPEGTDVNSVFEQMTPYFTGTLGIRPETVSAFQTALKANPNLVLDDKALEALYKDRFTNTVLTPGSIALRGGREVARAPYKPQVVTTSPGATSTVFNPETGRFVTGAEGEGSSSAPGVGGGAPLTVDALRPHFIAQESTGDYTARNRETGALGAYQVMPDTGRALAQRLGLPWRPQMMTQDTPAARRYQDAIGSAAIQEAIDNSGGDPATAFSYYYGGSDRSRWGPRTRQYASEMMARIGGGAPQGPTITPTSVSVPPKPPAPKGRVRAATAEELRGYPAGTAAQVEEDTGKLVNIRTPPAASSKAAEKMADQEEKARSLIDAVTSFNEDLIHLMNQPGLDSILGVVAGRLPAGLLGQDAQNAANMIENLKQRIGLNELLKFKATSSQGASGFGNLSNEEGRRLEAAFGTLERTNSPDEFRRTLKRILDINTQVLRRQAAGFRGRTEVRRNMSGGGDNQPTVSNW